MLKQTMDGISGLADKEIVRGEIRRVRLERNYFDIILLKKNIYIFVKVSFTAVKVSCTVKLFLFQLIFELI